MSDISLALQEKDVELARTKLAASLNVLRDPETMAAFTKDVKNEATELKEELLKDARGKANAVVGGFVEDLKAKAAANPAAALAIGTGLAWRLLRHPPIASALIGMGLYSLFQTQATRSHFASQSDYLEEGKKRLREQADVALSKAKDVAQDVKESVSQQASDLSEAAMRKVEQWSGTKPEFPSFESPHPAFQNEETVFEPSKTALQDPDVRDKMFLGVAGLAVAAALGIACHKRLIEAE